MKQAKAHKLMLDELKSGDEISTSGGILGKVTKINNQFAIVEVSKNVELKIQKQNLDDADILRVAATRAETTKHRKVLAKVLKQFRKHFI